MKKRVLSIVFALCMVVSLYPAAAFAAVDTGIVVNNVVDGSAANLCEHHTRHDASCGYIQQEEAQACGHLPADGTYSCAPKAQEGVAPATDSTFYVCAHGDNCNYGEAVSGAPCGYVCATCASSAQQAQANAAKAEEAYSAVVTLLQALPGADSITAETAEESKQAAVAQLDAAMSAFDALTAEQQTTLKTQHIDLFHHIDALRVALTGGVAALTGGTKALHADHCVCGGTITSGNHVHTAAVAYQPLEGKYFAHLPSGNYYLTADLTLPMDGMTTAIGANINLCLNGYALSNPEGNSAIVITNNGTLNICDCSADETGKITGGRMGGTSQSALFGGGVLNSGNCTINFYGGSITKNGLGYQTLMLYAGGVYNQSNSTFRMYGGSIVDNRCDKDGAGIYNLHGTVEIFDGIIANNHAAQGLGGGIYNISGTLTVENGAITGNTTGAYGGGVYNNGTFHFKNGSISGNQAGNRGGGVYTTNKDSEFVMTGGSITENINSGVDLNAGKFSVSGDVTIMGNKATKEPDSLSQDLFIADDKKITVTGPLTGKIGITMEFPGIFTTGDPFMVDGVSKKPGDYINQFESNAPNNDHSLVAVRDGTQLAVLPKCSTPSAVFTGTGVDSGILSNLADGTEYSLDGGNTWTKMAGDPTTIASGVAAAYGVHLICRGDAASNADSNIQIITLTQAAAPQGVGKTDETASGNDGTLTGVTSEMQYCLSGGSDAEEWKDCGGTTVTNLAAGMYNVRVKGKESALASPSVSVTILPHAAGKVPQVISFETAAVQKTYGNEAFTVPVTQTTVMGIVTYVSSNGNVATVNTDTGKVSIVGAGTATITATAAETATHAPATASYNLTVAKKGLTVTADSKSMTRGTAIPDLTVTYTGFVGAGNEANALATKAVAATAADGTKTGTFPITFRTNAVLKDSASKNYTLRHTEGTLAVTDNVVTHTITAITSAGGTISPIGAVAVIAGEGKTFAIAAESGYSIKSVIVDGVDLGAITSYTFTNVTGNHTISASFTAHAAPSVIPRTGDPSSAAWLIPALSAALLWLVGKQRGIIKANRK